MSDHWIAAIPQDPYYVPAEAGIDEVVAYLKEIARESDEVTYAVDKRVQFRDCGQNLESISCPYCGADMDTDWWQERMDEDGDEDGFRLGSFTLPCCSRVASLNDLKYSFEQGFSLFIVEAMNPNIGELLPQQIQRLSELLGTEIRIVYQHL